MTTGCGKCPDCLIRFYASRIDHLKFLRAFYIKTKAPREILSEVDQALAGYRSKMLSEMFRDAKKDRRA